MTLREEFEAEVKTNKGGVSILFETSNQHYIEWLENRVKNLSSNTAFSNTNKRWYKSSWNFQDDPRLEFGKLTWHSING